MAWGVGGNMLVGGVGKSAWWGWVWPAKPKTECCELSFGQGYVNQSAMDRGSVCNKICVVVDVTVHCVGQIMWGAGFGWQN
jgi:hypothetical protein